MIGERTHEGLEVRLRPRGAGRFLVAAFLTAWLFGWTMGEGFALWVLVHQVRTLLTGEAPAGQTALGPALLVIGFLVVWLSIWTVGGVFAWREWLRLLWAEDRLVAMPDRLAIVRQRGPFGMRREIARTTLRALSVERKGGMLVAETDRKRVVLSALGDRPDREAALDALRSALGMDAIAPDRDAPADARRAPVVATASSGLPEGWEETQTPEGETVLIAASATRRAQARVMAGLAIVAGAGTAALVRAALADLSLAPLAAIVAAVSTAIAWGAIWLARGRMEWRIGGGRLILRRRFGAKLRDLFEGRRLVLSSRADSDGDEWFQLEAMGDLEPVASPARVARGVDSPVMSRTAVRPHGRTIVQAMNDSLVPRRLGEWISRRADVPLEDRTTADGRAASLAALRAQLPSMGVLGRLAARAIDLAEAREKRR